MQAGERLRSGDFFSKLVPGQDLFLVENPTDPQGPPITGGRLRVVWPDSRHRYPWQPGCDPDCARQALILDTEGLDVESLHLLLSRTGKIENPHG